LYSLTCYKLQCLFGIAPKLFRNCHQSCDAATSINAKQIALKLFSSPDMCTHTYYLRDKTVTKQCNFTLISAKAQGLGQNG